MCLFGRRARTEIASIYNLVEASKTPRQSCSSSALPDDRQVRHSSCTTSHVHIVKKALKKTERK